MPFPIEILRQDTPFCQNKIFLNSAGASLMPSPVLQVQQNCLQEETKVGGYDFAAKAHEAIEQFYVQTAQLINAQTHQIAFANSATDAYAKALASIIFEKGDAILTTDDDYVANQLFFLSFQKRFGIKLLRGRNLENGDLDLQHFEELIKKHQPKLVAVTHIPTNSGLVQDVEAIGKLCEQYDVWYLVDACQSVGQWEVDVQKIQCDFLTATGRKFLRAPRGTGFLYVSDEALEHLSPLFFDLQGSTWDNANEFTLSKTAKRFEFFERPIDAMIGLAEAIKYANQLGIATIQNYNQILHTSLRKQLTQIEDVMVYDKGSVLSSIVTFGKKGRALEELQKHLSDEKVYFSVSPKMAAMIDFTKKEIDGAIRFSPHYFNTLEEINKVCNIVSQL